MAVLDSAEKSYAILNFSGQNRGVVWADEGIEDFDSNQLLGVEREFILNPRSQTPSSSPDPGTLWHGSGNRRIRV